MGEGFDIKELDYNMILMSHLNRLSMVTTGSNIDVVQIKGFENAPSLGERNLDWGVHFLYCLIPDDLFDEDFKKSQTEYFKERKESQIRSNFSKLKALINLLNRRGLLMTKSVVADKKSIYGDDFEK